MVIRKNNSSEEQGMSPDFKGANELEKGIVSTNLKNIDGMLDKEFKGPAGKLLKPEVRDEIKRRTRKRVVGLTRKNIDVSLSASRFPFLMALRTANEYIKTGGLPMDLKVETVNDSILDIDGGHFALGRIPQEFFTSREMGHFDARSTKLLEQGIPEQIIREFEKKYGPKESYGGIPLWGYAIRRVILGERNPKEFFGRTLLDLKKKFMSRYKDVEGIEPLAAIAYGLESEDSIYDPVPSARRNWREWIGTASNAIVDTVFDKASRFEEARKSGSVVEAFLKHSTNGYYLGDVNLRKQLRNLDRFERRKEIGKLEEKFGVINSQDISDSKKVKLKRLASHDDSFFEFLRGYASEGEKYVRSLPQNVKTDEELARMGINLEVWYHGKGSVDVVMDSKGTKPYEEVRSEVVNGLYNEFRSVFDGEILRSKGKLESKLMDTLKKKNVPVPEGKSILEYLISSTDDEVLKTAGVTIADYLSVAQNSKNPQEAAARAHNLRRFSRFLREGKHTSENGEKSYNASVKLTPKNPFLDVDLGNDGGACIGIFGGDIYGIDEETEWTKELFLHVLRNPYREVGANGCYMPFYLKDSAFRFNEFYLGNQRSALGMLIAGKNEHNEPVLTVNSIQYNERVGRERLEDQVYDAMGSYIFDFAKAAGFKYVVFNDSITKPPRGYRKVEQPGFNTFTKIDHWGEDYYTDILDGAGSMKIGRGKSVYTLKE